MEDLIKIIKIIEINSLVVSGGGIKGFLSIGAIKLLFENNIINKIRFYYGTSFGSIIVLLLNLGWNCEEILKFSDYITYFIVKNGIIYYIDNNSLSSMINIRTYNILEKENEVSHKLDINSDDFTLTNENLDILETKVLHEKYTFNLKKFKY